MSHAHGFNNFARDAQSTSVKPGIDPALRTLMALVRRSSQLVLERHAPRLVPTAFVPAFVPTASVAVEEKQCAIVEMKLGTLQTPRVKNGHGNGSWAMCALIPPCARLCFSQPRLRTTTFPRYSACRTAHCASHIFKKYVESFTQRSQSLLCKSMRLATTYCRQCSWHA